MKKWLCFCLLFCTGLTCAAEVSRLTVYVYPPSDFLDESTPKSVIKGFYAITGRKVLADNSPQVQFVSDFNEPGSMSSFFLSSMGHTMSHVKCELSNGQWYDRWASLTGMEFLSQQFINIFGDNLGFGFVLYDYKDGTILSGAENRMRLTYYKGPATEDKNGNLHFARPRYMEFRLKPVDCDELNKMITFYESFHYPNGTSYSDLEKKNPEDVLYFSPNYKPYGSFVQRMSTGHGKVGGGCTTFGVGLIEAAHKLEPELNALIYKTKAISENLIGGTRDKSTGRVRRVSLAELLVTDLGNHWTYPGVNNVVIDGYEPQKTWDFIGSTIACLKNHGKNCSSEMTTWLNKKGPKVYRGPQQIFSDTIQNSEVTLNTAQPIDGIIVDL